MASRSQVKTLKAWDHMSLNSRSFHHDLVIGAPPESGQALKVVETRETQEASGSIKVRLSALLDGSQLPHGKIKESFPVFPRGQMVKAFDCYVLKLSKDSWFDPRRRSFPIFFVSWLVLHNSSVPRIALQPLGTRHLNSIQPAQAVAPATAPRPIQRPNTFSNARGMIFSTAAVSLPWGNGPPGTDFPRNLQSGAHPSLTFMTKSLSAGRALVT